MSILNANDAAATKRSDDTGVSHLPTSVRAMSLNRRARIYLYKRTDVSGGDSECRKYLVARYVSVCVYGCVFVRTRALMLLRGEFARVREVPYDRRSSETGLFDRWWSTSGV